ncbi:MULTISPECIES: deoxyguanosinetriphosphate triphosphohydrolase [Ruminococcus]|jgi:dGTPase|uniref:Putative dGTPase n=1 Tax=Ruminococcus albus 8 TaxID=246199 RepID=E9S7E9_RUMAL|nr:MULTISPECIES: deoxyguanosinetriphosphate triphosphohydrolase [Ruminococcus]EGC04765.1 putative dGTPase [Ruminococcus albus 8]MBO5558789.1 deoxyguanosinetriphosphate triphosphohydrolase [Ruminococcus sp.]MCC3349427.1 deoxyguanosinetriphosphate triphosphohydrolase [Ruminococcus albus 8]
MLPREQSESFEHTFLCEKAAFADATTGRERQEDKCGLRTEFQRDRDRILHCNSFRRLKHKTQVFLSPAGDHYRTRLTHTLEVSQIARTIARALRLNEDLTEAIALGHDLGHTPFGHAGERMLNELSPYGFHHYEQSLRVVDILEKDGAGLNLTREVRDGILKHTNQVANTYEGYAVRFADVIAYINHDIDDSIRAGILKEEDIPSAITNVLGHSKSARITTLVCSLIENGLHDRDEAEGDEGILRMSAEVEKAYKQLHRFMFDSVYTNPACKSEERKAQDMIAFLYKYYTDHIEALPAMYMNLAYHYGVDMAVCDYISGMTDVFAVETFKELFIPAAWMVK